jgi:hypothetical protein
MPFVAPLNAGVMPRWRNARALSLLTLPAALRSVVAQAKGAMQIPASGITVTATSGELSS